MLRVPRCPKAKLIWCGPYAVGVLLGLDYDEAYRVLLADVRRAAAERARAEADAAYNLIHPDEVRKRLPIRITGIHSHQVGRLLNKRGVRCDFNYHDGKPLRTLKSFVRHEAEPGYAYLIDVAHHWVVVHNGLMYNSLFRPVSVEKAPSHKMARVLQWSSPLTVKYMVA